MNTQDNYIRGIIEASMCDWPGKVVTALFLGGCNLRCPTCHNWQLATDPDSINSIPEDRVIDYLSNKRRWIDGVVVSGGEPTLSSRLPFLLVRIQALGLPINLHTNGFNPAKVRELLISNLVDVFSVDVKGPWSKYPGLAGGAATAARAKSNLEEIFGLAAEYPDRFYFRTTHVPALTEEDIAICRSYLPSGHELHTQEYREPAQLQDDEFITREFGMVLVVDNETNEDVAELPVLEALPVLKDLGFENPVSAIIGGGNDKYMIIDNL